MTSKDTFPVQGPNDTHLHEPLDVSAPGLTPEQDARIDQLVNNGFNYTEAFRIAGTEVVQTVAQPALQQTVSKPKYPRSRRGLGAAGLRIADNDRKFRPER